MDRAMAAALIEQLGRDLPSDVDLFWFSERVGAVAARCAPTDRPYVYQLALWQLDDAGLLTYDVVPRFRA